MGKITDFYRVVSPTQAAATVHDNQMIDQGYAFSSNFTWYQRLIQGSASRLTRYREYDIMDNDVEIARALDIIAEEMTSRNNKTNMVLDIDLQVDDGQDIDETVVLTLRSALRHWSTIHGFTENRLFKIARNMIKYGDCFFKIHSPYKKWEWIPASNVIGAVVDAQDVTKVLAYQVRMDSKVPNSNSAQFGGTGSTAVGSQAYSTEIIPIEQMAVFSINDDMSETAPFGDSALRTVYKTHKQKELLEDAIVIYRIQRAPERRVFYIDVGKMQPNRIKAYLETIKNEIRQKKIPSQGQNGKDSVDAVYNPASISEDFFLAQRSDGKGSKVEVLPGGQSLGEMTDLDYFMDKVLRGLRVPISWMKTGVNSAMFNDGKVGASYVEEQQFSKFVERLQVYIECEIDKAFKSFLFASNINIDSTLFKIALPSPSNYEHYQQAEADTTLLNTLSQADAVPYLSKRFVLSRYAQLSEDEIITNEQLLKQEKGFDPDADKSLQQIYGAPAEGAGGMGSMGAGGGGMGSMGDMGLGGEPGEGELGAEGTPGEAGALGAEGTEHVIPVAAPAAPPPAA